jgi:hypothetical protein
MTSTMQETWRPLDEFPNYAVSTFGRVINTSTDLIKRGTCNQAGILVVNLRAENRQHIRSVAVLVVNAFMDDPRRPPHFDTPIHLDGNKRNCRVDNLQWRPRWFARKYHQQFSDYERKFRFGIKRPVRNVETGEEFPTSWEAAIKYGLLDFDIMMSVANRTYVFPLYQRFEVIE